MRRKILRHLPSPRKDTTPMLVCMVVAGGVVVMSGVWLLGAPFWTWPLDRSGNQPTLFVDLRLFRILLCVYAVWMVAVTKRWIPVSSGTGLALAAFAVAHRCLVEVGRSLFGPHQFEALGVEFQDTIYNARMLGMIGYIAGLAFVASACFAEWRMRAQGAGRRHLIERGG